ncbi:MAG TPA: PIG-L family deacetylase [Candidatus Limnocylindria bacterium]|nr:PIG-L family deacetylase [Candidatus Limnocylindria bacterium]
MQTEEWIKVLMRGRTPTVRSRGAVAGLGTILGVWAHPDDEAYLSGGLMAIAREAGSRVVCVTATHGELGTNDPVTWRPPRLAAERTKELVQSLVTLGVREHEWLRYPDGGLEAVDEVEAVDRIVAVIENVRPDTVLTFGPDGFTGHTDHCVVSAWTTTAFDQAAHADARLLYAAYPERRLSRWSGVNERYGIFPSGYPICFPGGDLAVDLELDEEIAGVKARALKAQVTQTSGLIQEMGLARYTDWVADEAFVERRSVSELASGR